MSIFGLRSNSLASSAYKNLSRTQGSLNDNISRLASGLRINKADDDSAGSAISTRMSNQLRGMKQANRNAQDTNNLLTTAESGLSDISDILSKMRELSVQASTDTLNDVDRGSLDLEYQSLLNEISRISKSTNYNDLKVLNAESVETVISPEAEKSGVNGISLNRAKAGVYRFESKVPGELTLIHTLSGEEQTVTVPTDVGQGTSLNFSELGVQVELNNQYDGSVVIGQETVDQAQDAVNVAQADLDNARVVLVDRETIHEQLHVALNAAQDILTQAQDDYDNTQNNLNNAKVAFNDAEVALGTAQDVFDVALNDLYEAIQALQEARDVLQVAGTIDDDAQQAHDEFPPPMRCTVFPAFPMVTYSVFKLKLKYNSDYWLDIVNQYQTLNAKG